MNSHSDPPLDSFGIEDPPLRHTPQALREQALREQALTDVISAVIAVDESRPLRPHASSLAAIHQRIAATPRVSRWRQLTTWSGWATAAAVTLFFILRNDIAPTQPIAADAATESAHSSALQNNSQSSHLTATDAPSVTDVASTPPPPPATVAKDDPVFREQQRSLIQEIETLREKVTILANRDSERFIPNDGVSWPIIMKLTAPEQDPDVVAIADPVMRAFLAPDMPEMAAARSEELPLQPTPDPTLPSAVPIYDPARDVGQLLVSNLEAPTEGESYFLWIQSDTSEQPVLVGTLPDNIAESETFDFKLGSTGIIPERFLITQDTLANPSSPNDTNTILFGPSAPKK